MNASGPTLVLAAASLMASGCARDHAATFRVQDARTLASVEDATVRVERVSMYMLSLRAQPDFPRVQASQTAGDGEVQLRLIDGDVFVVSAFRDGYSPSAVRFAPWRKPHRGDMIMLMLEPVAE